MLELKELKKDDSFYPEKLKDIFDAPDSLLICGKLPEQRKLIALKSNGSIRKAKAECKRIVDADAVVVSTLEGRAEISAVRALVNDGAEVVAVITKAKLSRQTELCEKIALKGAVILEPENVDSERSLYRIAMGLSDEVRVTCLEKKKSTHLFAAEAIEQGKKVVLIDSRDKELEEKLCFEGATSYN